MVRVMRYAKILGKLVTASQKRCKTDTQLQRQSNRKLYVTYQKVLSSITLHGREGHFSCFLPAYNISTDTEHLADLLVIAKLLMAVGITHDQL